MTQPTVWRLVGIVSSVVGFLCFGLSSSFPYMFGKWIWWKICVYGIFGIITCLVLLLAKERQRQTSPWDKAHFAFSVFSIICVYTFFWDEVVKVKPDAYILISSTAFAIMSFILSRLSPSGVAIDLLNFFCGNLIAQLMKIKLLLGIAGAGFSYSLFILRSRLDALADPVLPIQDTLLNSLLPLSYSRYILRSGLDGLADTVLPVQDTILNPVRPDQIPVQDTLLNSLLPDQLPVQDTLLNPVRSDQIPVQNTLLNSLLPDQLPVQDTILNPVRPDQIPVQNTLLNSLLPDQLPVQDTILNPVRPDQIPVQDTLNSLLPDQLPAQDTELTPLLSFQNDDDDSDSDSGERYHKYVTNLMYSGFSIDD